MSTLDFAKLVTHFRQERGLSQGQLAQATRLSRTYIFHLETGMRKNPSQQVVHRIARALELKVQERQQLYAAFSQLTGQQIDDTPVERALEDLGDLAQMLVFNTSSPAHSLDRLWYLHSWNQAAGTLFQIDEERTSQRPHVLELVFGAQYRQRFLGWENLARRLVNDFQYQTQTLMHGPEYKELSKKLRDLPDYRRIAEVASTEGKPVPSCSFSIQHNQLGHLALHTATTVFIGVNTYSLVSYFPRDPQTLRVFRQYHWHQNEVRRRSIYGTSVKTGI